MVLHSWHTSSAIARSSGLRYKLYDYGLAIRLTYEESRADSPLSSVKLLARILRNGCIHI